MARSKVSLPKTLFVAVRGTDDDDPFFLAEPEAHLAIEDDGPTVVGEYQLVSSSEMVKRAVVVQKSGK